MRLIDVDALPDDAGWCGDALIEAINNAPTIDLEPKWTPCSEELPKKPCECLATIEVRIWENTHRIVRKVKFANGRFKEADKVVAWMPLPKPYEEMVKE